MNHRYRLYFLLSCFVLSTMTWAFAQEKPQPEKRYVRWRLIEVARKSLADSILVQLQKGTSFQKLARQHSLHASSKEGGEMGWVESDSIESDFKITLKSLPIGKASSFLQKGNHFFVLLKMNELSDSGYLQWQAQKSEVDSLLARGNTRLDLSQYRRAIAYFDNALVITRDIGDGGSEAKSLGNLGIAYRNLAQYPRAIAYYDSALRIVSEIGDRSNEGWLLGNLGSAYRNLAQYPRAIAYYNSALIIARDIGNRRREGAWLGGLGNAYSDLAQYHRAATYYDSALVIACEIGDRRSEGAWLGSLGNTYLSLAQHSRATAYYDSALVIARQIGDRRSEGAWLGNLGITYRHSGQYPRAIAYYDSALVIAREIGDRRSEGAELGKLGNAYLDLAQYPRAIAYYDSALVIAREIGNRSSEGAQLGKMGNIYLDLGQYPRAIAYYDSALGIAREIGDRSSKGVWLGNLSIPYFWLTQYPRAIAYADSALLVAKEINDVQGIWNWSWSLAKSHSKMPETPSHQVIDFYEKAVSALDSITGQLVEDPQKLSFLEDKQGLYQDFINYLLLQGKPIEQQRALEISEQARARAFMELIARRFHGSEVKQKRELLAPANFQQIQQTAHRLAASILTYFISDSSLVVWLMQPDGQLHTAAVPIKPAHFDSLLDICYLGFHQMQEKERTILNPDFLATRNVRPVTGSLRKFDFTPYLNELYQTLFPKAIRAHLPQEDGAKLLLVPHRRLSVIPIMALKDSTGHYLLEKYGCHQVPGIGVLLRTSEILENRQKPGKIRGNEMLLFGNPKMPNWGRQILPPLNGTETEVEVIAGKFKTGFQIGADASEHAFKSSSRNKRLLHLATHGISFDALPLESFVALAPGNGEDGQLTAAEILEMQFETDLAVLSACETGLGKISGDGVEGLARSFMASGVPSVLVSLWNVDDEATKELMLAFYDNLNKGMDKAEALRQAQLKIMRTPKWRHPKYWAAFVLYGER